jgi:hypothetical protein
VSRVLFGVLGAIEVRREGESPPLGGRAVRGQLAGASDRRTMWRDAWQHVIPFMASNPKSGA